MGIGPIIAGGAALLGGLFGSPTASNVQLPPQFQMPYMGEAATGAYQGTQNLPGANYGQQTAPLALQTGLNLYNNPYAGQFQQAAGPAGQMGQMAGLNQFAAGSLLGGAGGQLTGQIPSLLAAGFDPQNQLYDYTLKRLQDQTGANLANAGVGTTPYGQSVMGTTLGNFNMDWQNNQLNRMLAASQGAGGLAGTGGQAFGQMGALQGQAPSTYMAGAGLPYQTFAGIGQGQLGGLSGAQSTVGGAQALSQQQIADYLSYIGQGNQANQVANQNAQLALNQANMAFNQNQILGQGIGGGLGMMFGGGSPFGGNMWNSGGGFGGFNYGGMPNFGSQMML